MKIMEMGEIMKFLKSKAGKVIAIILCIPILITASVYGYGRYQLSKVKTVAITETADQLEANTYVVETTDEKPDKKLDIKPDIKNIAFIGIDAKDKDGGQRSDTVMIATIDNEHKKIKLTSILRDTYVDIPDIGYSRMGHTYAYGGAVLTIKTINRNFKMDITDYVKVDFEGLSSIVDAVGGIKIDIKAYELPSMQSAGIKKAGSYTLNGDQALAYSRIRHEGMKDYERTQRQRLVIEKVFEGIKNKGPAAFPAMVSKLLPYVETTLNSSDIIKLGTEALTSGIGKIEQARIPFDEYKKEEYIKGEYYITMDTERTIELLHKFIYEK
jgi:polyisoprenyl-teichoic acid--peptidoglycan teichoic acid transferase